MIYFLIFLISVEATILVTGFVYMRLLYWLYTDGSGIENYLSFKQVSVKKISWIIISLLWVNLLIGMSLSTTLTNIMNWQALIITVVGSFFIPPIIPQIEAILKIKLPWAIVKKQNQHTWLRPENMTKTIKKLEKVKDYQSYKKNYLPDINRGLEDLISSELQKTEENSDYDPTKTIINFLIDFNKSSIIEEIRKDFFSMLIDFCDSQKNILYGSKIIYKSLDEGIILPIVESKLDKIFEKWFKELENLNPEGNNFKDALSKKYEIFDLDVKCLHKLINQWKKSSSYQTQNNIHILQEKLKINRLAWGNHGIMNLFRTIHSHLSQLITMGEEKKKIEYLENFAVPVIQQLYDIYNEMFEFGIKSDKTCSYLALNDLFGIYSPKDNQDIRNKLDDLRIRLGAALGQSINDIEEGR